MPKIKILSVGECSYLSSGYARYNHGLLTELHKNPNYEIMEFGLSYNPTFNQADSIPWRFIPNVLPQHRVIDNHQKLEEWKNWAQNPINALGGPLFNSILLETQPDIVIANQDDWNLRYIIDSPYRHIFKTVLLFACDSSPQKWDWIESMSRTDAVMTYTHWAKEMVESQSKVKVSGVASPSCQESFQPLDKGKCRESFGLNPKSKIIGTVMRNQIRKKFPTLFEAFRKYLDNTNSRDTWLWVHSKYPDNSWDFPQLIQLYEIADRVLFTYTCLNQNCKNTFCGVYQDVVQCPNCKELSGCHPGSNQGISSEDLCRIYNCFDVSCLISSREGYGIPTTESASCGVPLIVTDFAALKDAVKYLGAEPVRVQSTDKDIQSGQLNAITDLDHLVEVFTKFFIKPENVRKTLGKRARLLFEQSGGWEKCARVWSDAIENVYTPANWKAPLRINQTPQIDYNMSNENFARWLISFCGMTDRLNSVYENEIVRSLIHGSRANLVGNGINSPYNKDIAYNEFRQVNEFRNHWETIRGKVLGVGQ